VPVPDWIWFVFIFAFGCCIGSFLNVVIYRLPRDKSLVTPPSACPSCDKHIRFYDNIPLVSWLLLGRKCRFCRAPISPRYFIVELLTGSLFLGLFILYHRTDVRPGLGSLTDGRWLVYLVHIVLLGAFIAASAIDLEYWVIPLSICWFVTAAGLIASAVGVYVIPVSLIRQCRLLPWATAGTAALVLGAAIGLGISWVLVVTGLIKRSYEPNDKDDCRSASQQSAPPPAKPQESPEPQFNHRLESCREVLFLLPIIASAIAAYWILSRVVSQQTWSDFPSQHPALAGLLGSLFGYFVGCGTVWAVRILGTLGFGKEAMGLGDVHLMGAAGAVIGPLPVVVAFFIAPFLGLAWAGCQMFFKKIRQIPYGPFLSLGVLTVMIFNDWIWNRIGLMFYR
jgi:leader peptidase (prepilin peptidase)/N-methyltransferase